jgi:hypothetical protein
MSDGPTLFDLANPLELRVETTDLQDDAETAEHDASEARDVAAKVDQITAELVRLLEEGGVPANNRVPEDSPHPVRKAE